MAPISSLYSQYDNSIGHGKNGGILNFIINCKERLDMDRWIYSASTTSTTSNYDPWCQVKWDKFGNVTAEAHYNDGYGSWSPVITPTPHDRLLDVLRRRQAPGIRVAGDRFWTPSGHRRPQAYTTDIREIRARGTLARMIGTQRMRRYLRDGFVTAHNSKSGRIYQVFPGNGITCVYEDGNLIERLCVVLRGNYPPTDSLIVRYLLALNDESRLWKLSNKHGAYYVARSGAFATLDLRPLTEIFKELKRGTAFHALQVA